MVCPSPTRRCITSSGTSSSTLTDPQQQVRRGPVIAALALGGFGIGTTEFVAMGLLPNIATAMHVSEPQAGQVISAYALGVVVGAPLIAAATARCSRRSVLSALLVAFTVGNLAAALAPNYHLLMVARFVAGLPHGAFFGVASLVAAHVAGPGRRAKAVGQVMMGLSVANVIGVPAATVLGDVLGWRAAFAVVVAIGAITVATLMRYLPPLTDMATSNPVTELGALRRGQVWLTLLVGIVGFGGMFAFYTYIRTTLTDVSGLGSQWIFLALMLFGLGMVVGSYLGGAMADRGITRAIFVGLIAIATTLTVFAAVAGQVLAALVMVFVVGTTGSALVPALQTRLMDVADDAQTLAAALNHSALNIANAAGAALGGVVLAAGWGYRAPSLLGAGLAVAGLAVMVVAVVTARRAGMVRGA